MNEQRLSDLAILSIERELSNNLSLDDVVTEFSGVDQNRRILLYYFCIHSLQKTNFHHYYNFTELGV